MNLDGVAGVVGVGIDLVDIDRMRAALNRTPSLAKRLFTEVERDQCAASMQRFAVRFAAKEAAMKALGVGIGAIGWHDVAVHRADTGAPELNVTGRAQGLAENVGGTRWLVSLTHTDTLAQAVVLLCRVI